MSAFGRAAGIVLVVGVFVSACGFEKRPDLAANDAAKLVSDDYFVAGFLNQS